MQNNSNIINENNEISEVEEEFINLKRIKSFFEENNVKLIEPNKKIELSKELEFNKSNNYGNLNLPYIPNETMDIIFNKYKKYSSFDYEYFMNNLDKDKEDKKSSTNNLDENEENNLDKDKEVKKSSTNNINNQTKKRTTDSNFSHNTTKKIHIGGVLTSNNEETDIGIISETIRRSNEAILIYKSYRLSNNSDKLNYNILPNDFHENSKIKKYIKVDLTKINNWENLYNNNNNLYYDYKYNLIDKFKNIRIDDELRKIKYNTSFTAEVFKDKIPLTKNIIIYNGKKNDNIYLLPLEDLYATQSSIIQIKCYSWEWDKVLNPYLLPVIRTSV